MVTHPEAYPWSSWHATVGTRRSVRVTPDPEYLALGSGDDERYTCYRAMVLRDETEAMAAQLRDATQQNAAFGSPRFA
ncbi:MAG: transposase, partial [Alphaproteobacteria bacterium]|nr:transposase [Alphaproteobacteria bacterium]